MHFVLGRLRENEFGVQLIYSSADVERDTSTPNIEFSVELAQFK